MKKLYPYAVVSLVLGIVSFIQLLGIERALLSVIFGVIALRQIKNSDELRGEKLAYWGIALGIIYMAVILVLSIVKGGDILSILPTK